MNNKIIILLFPLSLLGFGIYSFSQIDLNLTLSSWFPYQAFQKEMINLGYFNRPLSTIIFLILIFSIFFSYLFLLKQIQKNLFTLKTFKIFVLITVLILIFSYPAFSHDIFNYIFDARTVLKHHQSPYDVRPLDYKNDPWTRFMHWTHRPSVFPPGWIFLSFSPYLLGFGKFTLTLINFKIFVAVFYLLSIIVFKQILKETKDKLSLFKLTLFSLNPLVITESLISAHMDIVMVFFALFGFYQLLKKRYYLSFFLILFSASIKYITIYLLPVLLITIFFSKTKKRITQSSVINLTLFFSIIAFVTFVLKYGLNPWYFLWIFPFLILKFERANTLLALSFLTLFLTLHYAPFLYYGFWTKPTSTIRSFFTVLGALIFLGAYLFDTINLKRVSK